METFKKNTFFCVALFATAIGCKSHISTEDDLKLYNVVLEQIIYYNYYQYCLSDDKTKKIDEDFFSGVMKEANYLKIVDSLKTVRKRNGPKCKIDYTDRLGLFYKRFNL